MPPVVPLGSSGLHITRVGIGAWAFGGSGWIDTWGSQDDADSIDAIRTAVGRGLNWIDTAPIYGVGHSEEVVGRALGDIPADERPYVFTKAGVVWDPRRPLARPSLVGAPASLRAELEASLRRLGLERIDLYQVHAPPEDGTPVEEYWQTFCELRQEGKVRAIGLSNHDVPLLEAAAKVGRIDSVQPKLNLIHRDALNVLAWCADNGVGAIVYSPMASGLLTGRFRAERAQRLAADDWRLGHPDFSGDTLSRNLALAEALRPVAERRGIPVAAVAVSWTLAVRGVTGAIVGLRRSRQIEDWLTAATARLDDGDLAEIASAIERTGAGSGPVPPAHP